MRYETMEELAMSVHEGKAYWIGVIALTIRVDGDMGVADVEPWEEGDQEYHPFECAFDDRAEAIAYARTFDADMARWAHEHGNGTKHETVAVNVVEDSVFAGSDEGLVVFTREWNIDDTFDEIEWDEDGNAHYTSPDKEFEEWANTHDPKEFFGDELS